jgi:hypothetical protein
MQSQPCCPASCAPSGPGDALIFLVAALLGGWLLVAWAIVKRPLLSVRGTHLPIAGASGAGKSSVLWSLLSGVAQEIRGGRVALWAIDPKGGQELGPAARCSRASAAPTSTPWLTCCRRPSASRPHSGPPDRRC